MNVPLLLVLIICIGVVFFPWIVQYLNSKCGGKNATSV